MDEVVTASDVDTLVLVFVGWLAFGGLVLAAAHLLLRGEHGPLERRGLGVTDDEDVYQSTGSDVVWLLIHWG